MRQEDLRIGNKVYYTLNTTEGILKTPVTIRCLHLNVAETVEAGTFGYSQLEGIPNSEQRLISLGFEKYSGCFYKIRLGKILSEGWYLSERGEVTKCFSEINVRLRHMHNVQNLIYDMTGITLLPKDTNPDQSAKT